MKDQDQQRQKHDCFIASVPIHWETMYNYVNTLDEGTRFILNNLLALAERCGANSEQRKYVAFYTTKDEVHLEFEHDIYLYCVVHNKATQEYMISRHFTMNNDNACEFQYADSEQWELAG